MAMYENVGESNSGLLKPEPVWVSATLRLLPAPVFAVTAVIGCLIVAAIFLVQSLIDGGVAYWCLFGLFSFLSAVVCTASIARRWLYRDSAISSRYDQAEAKPIFSVVVLMAGVYSWMLTIGMHVFHGVFQNGTGTTKYYVTLAIAVVSSVFMKLIGLQEIRKHFGTGGGRGVVLTGTQAVVVFAMTLAFGGYLLWLIV